MRRRITKPLGVSILSVFDGVVMGLLPLTLLIVLDRDPKFEIPLWNYILAASINIALVAAALGAFMGENAGRIAILCTVTLHSLLMILNNFDLLADNAQSAPIASIGNFARGVFWIGINWWYFNRKGVVEYYRQPRPAS